MQKVLPTALYPYPLQRGSGPTSHPVVMLALCIPRYKGVEWKSQVPDNIKTHQFAGLGAESLCYCIRMVSLLHKQLKPSLSLSLIFFFFSFKV